MKISTDEKIIGRVACTLYFSVASGNLMVRKEKITGYMVEAAGTSIRFESGCWVSADKVFMPDETENEIEKFKEKFLRRTENTDE